MADTIHRTNRINGALEQRFSVNTPNFPVVSWIINPDLSGVDGVPKIYWKTVVDAVVEMTALEKTAVDAAALDAHNTDTEALIVSRLTPPLPLEGITNSVDVSGLVITVNINSVMINNVTTVVADVALTKLVKVCYVYNKTSKLFSIEVFQKTDGLYGAVAADEQIAADFGEWSVGANGTVLVPV